MSMSIGKVGSLPIESWNGVYPVAGCTESLYANSIALIYVSQSALFLTAYARIIPEMVCMKRSLNPSVCGCAAVLRFNVVPIILKRFSQNLEVNRGSRSLMIVCGTPQCLMTLSNNIWATSRAVHLSEHGTICARRVSLSSITQTALLPLVVSGNAVFMSMVITSNGFSAIGYGTLSPAGLVVALLARWHGSHVFT